MLTSRSPLSLYMESDTSFSSLTGTVVQTIFSSPKDDFGVIALLPDGKQRTVICRGSLGHLGKGELVKVTGEWTKHPRFGQQLEIKSWNLCSPSSGAGLERFLGSGLVPGIGPALASRIVQHFGDETLDILQNQPTRLKAVRGLGAKKREALISFWQERDASSQFLLKISEHGIGMTFGMKIQKAYGVDAEKVLQQNPYRMIQDIPGFGFTTVDRLALKMGMEPNSSHRLQAGLLHTLNEAKEQGHCHLPRLDVVHRAAQLLNQDNASLETQVDHLVESRSLIWVSEHLVLPGIYHMEQRVADKVLQRSSSSPITPFDPRRLARVIKESSVELSSSQESSLVEILGRGLSILTGGPGVGKTTMVRLMVRYWERLGFEPVLVAPTGRAAQRMEEACGRSASTLHRAMKYNPQKGFVHKEGHPLEGKVFICDEFSMVDLELFEAFLEALPSRAQVVLVGDRDQLPSVGPGRVLGDLLDSKTIPAAHLKEVFRQAGGSLLVQNSHRLIAGKKLLQPDSKDDLKDFYFIEARDENHTLQIIKKLILERFPQRFGSDAQAGAQVLSPIKKGPLGTIELNHQLQNWLNPNGSEIHVGDQIFRVGDRVVQKVNNYDLELYNGDLGRVVGGDENSALVRFGEREVHYEQDAMRDLGLSYALTVHKSQGSEYPYIILPLSRSHRIMLHLELLYTAMTRARKMCVWVGQKDFLEELTTQPSRIERHTFLGSWLKQGGTRG